MRRRTISLGAAVLIGLCCLTATVVAESLRTECVVLITFDGLRWQELFQGADQRLLEDEAFVRDRPALRERFWDESPTVRRERLMPFFWQTICAEGQLFGDPDQNSLGRVTNGQNFSYPGYNELLTGFADERIDSNDKRPNPNVTVLEWLHQQDEFRGRVAAVASWDVVPFTSSMTSAAASP
jgi:hypothetical protein